MINGFSKVFYLLGRKSRDLRAVEKAIKTGSAMPLVKRFLNKIIGRFIVSKIWFR